jgi:hypothetical protein
MQGAGDGLALVRDFHGGREFAPKRAHVREAARGFDVEGSTQYSLDLVVHLDAEGAWRRPAMPIARLLAERIDLLILERVTPTHHFHDH